MYTKKVLGNILSERNFLHRDMFSKNNTKTSANLPATFSGMVGGIGGVYKPGGSMSAQVITYDPLTNNTYTDASKTNILKGGEGVKLAPMPMYNVANPAAKFAQEQGFKISMVKDPNGGQRGVIDLPGGKQIDQWDYYRQYHEPTPAQPVGIKSIVSSQKILPQSRDGKPVLFGRGLI